MHESLRSLARRSSLVAVCTIGYGLSAVHAQEAPTTRPMAPVLREPVRTGAQVVEGWVPDWSAEKDKDSKRVVVTVYRALSIDAECVLVRAMATGSSACAGLTLAAVDFTKPQSGVVHFARVVPDTDGSFRAALAERLVVGQRVIAVVDAGAANVSAPVSAAVEDPGDWGRVRAYFAGGAVFSHEREGFSEQDFALTFVMDKSWLQATPPRILDDATERRCGDRTKRRDLQRDDPCRTRRRGIGLKQLNSFLDVRLTSVPVVSGEPATDAGDEAEDPPADTLGDFVSARKAAVIQAGLYVPVYGRPTMWTYRNEPNALFIAPVVRWGIQTITEAPPPASSAGETPIVTGTGDADDDDVFFFWSAGVGIGHYRLTNSSHRAPELISYMHLTFGNYETFDRPGKSSRRHRILLEGRLKIPETPMQIGLDANMGSGPDSVSFVFATRFDIGELFAKLKQF